MLAACDRLGDVEVAAADSVARVQDVELGESAHRSVADGQERRLARVAHAGADVLGEFVGVGDGLYAHFGSARLERDVDGFGKSGKSRMDVENRILRVAFVFAAAGAEALQGLDDGAFGIGDGLELIGDPQKGASLVGDIQGEARRHDAAEELRDFLLDAVENVFAAEYVLDFILVGRSGDGVSDVRHHFDVARRHELDFAERLFAGDLWRELDVLVDVGKLGLLETLGLGGHHPGDE